MKKIKITPPPYENVAKMEVKTADNFDFQPGAAAPIPPTPGVDSLAAEAARLDQEGIAAFAGAEPGAEAADQAPAAVPSSELLRPLLGFVFDVYAPRWKVEPAKIDALAGAYGAVVDKYFPDGIAGKYAEEINALVLTVAIFGPLLKTPPRDVPAPKETPTDAAGVVVNDPTPAPTVQ